MIVKGDALRLPFADKTFDLVVGSPPYIEARLYLEDGEDKGISRGCREWIEWMLLVTKESLRVCKGPVIWVVCGTTKDRNYQPGPEGLRYRWWDMGGECHNLAPFYWNRSGIPGSGGDQWYRADVEQCLCFKRPGKLPYADPKANGHTPKYAPGGEMSNYKANGRRVNATIGLYEPPVIANPGNLLRTNNGGGVLGHKLAHENEAPYPVDVPRFFINSHCQPGGLVLDCFSGSGTTGHAALDLGRRYVGVDLRQSQCLLSRKRLATVTPAFEFFGNPD